MQKHSDSPTVLPSSEKPSDGSARDCSISLFLITLEFWETFMALKAMLNEKARILGFSCSS
jgi:hypothetical protein